MNILFMSLGEFENLSSGSVHIDVVKELSKNNNVYLACKRERRTNKPTEYTVEHGIHVLRILVGNVKKTNLIQKGIATLTLESIFLKEMKKYFKNTKFDLIIYTTPPITFVKPIKYFKKRDGAQTYLMLKDIFPQNAVDLGILSKKGIKAPVYKVFRNKEKELYRISDKIGCMSPANIKFIADNNELGGEKLELFPNCINIVKTCITDDEKKRMRIKYDLPLDKPIFVYGGNLGKPQGINFMLECLQNVMSNEDVFFLIVGNGTEFDKINNFVNTVSPPNVRLLQSLPKAEYERIVSACDVGMIFLDHRFTIPNFPARLLSYLQSKLPVLVVTDPNTDVGIIAEKNNFGWWVESNDVNSFADRITKILESDIKTMGENGYKYLIKNHDVSKCCNELLKHYC